MKKARNNRKALFLKTRFTKPEMVMPAAVILLRPAVLEP